MQQRIDFDVLDLESEHDSDVKSLSSRADGADAPGLTTKAEEEGLACSDVSHGHSSWAVELGGVFGGLVGVHLTRIFHNGLA